MELFALIFSVIALTLIGIGVAIGLIMCIVFALLLGLGIVSVSFLAAFRTGRAANGIRVFLLLCGILGGLAAGAGIAWFAWSLPPAHLTGLPVVLYGAIGGAFGGLIVALTLDYTLRYIQRWAVGRRDVR